MQENNTGGRRLREIAGVLRRHRVARGMTPEKLRLIFEDLGPTFVKFGQILSMRPDMLPQPYCEELARLRDNVHPMSFEEAAAVVEQELGAPPDALFAHFSRQPVGSASIAQVYCAELKDGRKTVVKIRRPGIYSVMERDVAFLRRFSGLLKIVGRTGGAIDFGLVIDEMWQAAKEEMDFLHEAAQAEEFRGLNENVAYVQVPRVYREYSTAAVLVMEYLDGIRIDDAAALEAAGYDRSEIGMKLTENYVKQIVDDGFFHADPHPGNLRILGGRIVWLDLGMMGRLTTRDRSILNGMITAAASGDVNEIVNLLLAFCEPQGSVDRAQLYADTDTILNRYAALDIGSMNLMKIRDDVLAMANRNGLSMPPGVTMLGRGLVTIEGVVSKVSPEINIMEVMVNHLSGRMLKDFDVKMEAQKLLSALLRSGRHVPNIPSQVSELLKMAIRGQMKTNVEITGSEQPLRAFERMADRVSLGMVEAGLLIASALLCAAPLPVCVLGIPFAGAAGFFLSFILGVILLWRIFHSDHT